MHQKGIKVAAVPSPNRSRGCGEVGGKKIVMAIAPPSKFSRRKLAHLYEHELLHTSGKEHEEMTEEEYWSKGGEPDWSKKAGKLTYKTRGQSILPK